MSADTYAWIDAEDAAEAHAVSLAEGGGTPGLRDPAALAGVLARPRASHLQAGVRDPVQLAALYTYGTLAAEPFVDANRRTAFLLGLWFLELNGHRFVGDPVEAAGKIVDLTTGALTQAGYAAFLRAHLARPAGGGGPPATVR